MLKDPKIGIMELMQAIKDRRAIRKFKPNAIPEEKITAVLEAAIWAPYASERWEFILVKNAEMRGKLARAAKNQKHVEEAPVDIVICSNLKGAVKRDRELYSIQEASAAIQNLMLKAHEEGLSTCWVSDFSEGRVRRALRIPRWVRPLAIIPLGYAAESPVPPMRKSLEKVLHREKY
ncbi:MAG: nitroreductase family protein [Halobacteria archaeon]